MKVLVACEESQAVTIELRKLGHEAYSCDIIPCSGGHPEWHLQVDGLELLKMKWDMIIAFPPCTYMTNAGACRMFPKKGQIDEARFAKAMEAKEFFSAFYNADCERIAIENPVPLDKISTEKLIAIQDRIETVYRQMATNDDMAVICELAKRYILDERIFREGIVHCQDCTIKKAVPHKDGIVWRCPHRTGDVKMEGYCESGRKGC